MVSFMMLPVCILFVVSCVGDVFLSVFYMVECFVEVIRFIVQ